MNKTKKSFQGGNEKMNVAEEGSKRTDMTMQYNTYRLLLGFADRVKRVEEKQDKIIKMLEEINKDKA